MKNNNIKKTVAVVGGGMIGISAALELSRSDEYQVTLFEKRERLGGLSGWFQWKDVAWDRFYHVILSTDTVMLDLIKELGIEGDIFWRNTKSGFYRDGRLVSMSSVMDFLKFPFMTLWQKFRLGLGILYSTRIKNPSKLDRIYVREWLTRVFGRRVYENIWEPLLRSKLGDAHERTSAAFIWATINRLYGARSSENKQEKMGHVRGGYKAILEAAEKRLKHAGVNIRTNREVESITTTENLHPSLDLMTLDGTFTFDRVLVTVDCPSIMRMVGNCEAHSYWKQISNVEYLGLICVMLILDRELSPFYVINLLDKELPFTGIIEATNIVPTEEVGGKHIVYLPKYVPASDPLNNKQDDEIKALFLAALRKVFPCIEERHVLHCAVSREKYVQPIQELNFLRRIEGFATPIENLYIINTSMIYNSTLNNNSAVSLGKRAAMNLIVANLDTPKT
jgi:protoporphyrinogen oxidase